MTERLEAFEAEIEVWTHNDTVVAVTYDGRPLHFSADGLTPAQALQYRDVYENGDASVVLAVEVPDEPND